MNDQKEHSMKELIITEQTTRDC